MFANYMPDKVLRYKMYKEYVQVNKNKEQSDLKIGGETNKIFFPKKPYEWSMETWKDVSHH